ncbi:hypothetical protein EDB89DRAFT_1904201 [Lactarius sanguifluus]|nr:hypothetical protein EDB89DRAFT_1904201 [Lactarius sanguifluus]
MSAEPGRSLSKNGLEVQEGSCTTIIRSLPRFDTKSKRPGAVVAFSVRVGHHHGQHQPQPVRDHPHPSTPLIIRRFTVSLVLYAGTVFLAYGQCATLPVSSDRSRPCAKPLADLDIGALAGTVAQTVSYPFEVVRWRMQVGGLTEPGRRCDVWLRSDNSVDTANSQRSDRSEAQLVQTGTTGTLIQRLAPLPTTATVRPTRAMSRKIYLHRIQALPPILGLTTTTRNNTHRRRSQQHTVRTCPGYANQKTEALSRARRTLRREFYQVTGLAPDFKEYYKRLTGARCAKSIASQSFKKETRTAQSANASA